MRNERWGGFCRLSYTGIFLLVRVSSAMDFTEYDVYLSGVRAKKIAGHFRNFTAISDGDLAAGLKPIFQPYLLIWCLSYCSSLKAQQMLKILEDNQPNYGI